MGDPTFGDSGITRTPWGSYKNVAWALAVQADGKPLIAGEVGASDTATGRTCGSGRA
jgi:hypothetical protein